MRKIIGIIILIVALVMGSKLVFDYYSYEVAPVELKFQALWIKDMALLENEKKLPKNWNEISEVKYNLLTENVKKWTKDISAPIVLKKNGTHRLEVTVTDWLENDKHGIVVQYHLIDKTTGDLVSEFGRTFIIENRPQNLKK
ncbi:MAG: hypothetical protein KDD58_14765 [Bdellovibrionales bacterium]|nr:hypothetical protein [Bdellovibrionales bacterium]